MSLHDELQRIADDAPRPDIDHSLWDRGRSLRRRDRLMTSAVVLVMVLTVGGLVALVTGPPPSVGPADDTVPGGAIPSRIEDVPTDANLPLETDLAIGQGSVAFVANGRPVVVGASDDRYYLLDLPAWETGSVLAISPSGDRLAWLSQPEDSDAPALSVLDLRTGEIMTPSTSQEVGFQPVDVSWSPSGESLAWLGETPSGSVFGTVREPGTFTAIRRNKVIATGRSGLVGVAVANDGALALGTESGGLLLDAHQHVPRQVRRSDGFPGSFSPDGEVLALETRIPGPLSSSVQVDPVKSLRHLFPDDTIGPATVRPMGWLEDRLQLLLVQESFDDDAEFVVTTPTETQTSTWRRSVGTVAPGAAQSLSVAVDLIPDLDGRSAQRLTHDFGEPKWAGRDISWLIGLGVAGALSVLYGLRWLWRRRTG